MSDLLQFNTGFIYYFSPDDLQHFIKYAPFNQGIYRWSQDDLEYIKIKLNTIKLQYQLPIINWQAYDNNKNGTYQLQYDLITRYTIPLKYILGCIIYHQLKYTMYLEATF